MILYNSHISPSFPKERFTSEKNGTGRYVSDKKHNNLSFTSLYAFHMRNVLPIRRRPVTTVNWALSLDILRISRRNIISSVLSKNLI